MRILLDNKHGVTVSLLSSIKYGCPLVLTRALYESGTFSWHSKKIGLTGAFSLFSACFQLDYLNQIVRCSIIVLVFKGIT